MYFLVLPFPIIDPVAIPLGPLAIRWYSLAYIGGIFLGWFYMVRLRNALILWRTDPPLTRQAVDDLLVWVALGIILGGRFGYVLFYNFSYYLERPLEIFAVWQGGMAFHGGFLGTILAVYLFSRFRGFSLLSLADLAAAATPIGLFFGRIANFINAELFGRVSDVPWAMIFPGGGPQPRHPSQLYQAGLEGMVLFALLAVAVWKFKSLTRPGEVTGLFFLLYGIFRIGVEFFRMPDPQIGFLAGGLTMGMALSIPMIPIGFALIWRAKQAPAKTA
ncbi:MAG: prolipoprotein diacylglyceryl transferase [Alphaproteobacteria bacterium]